MLSADEGEIQRFMDELTDAWNRGDARSYGARFRADGTFTNVSGAFFVGREEFDRRHEEVLRGIFKGSAVKMDIRKLRFLRPGVAVVDLDVSLSGATVRPPGVQVGAEGALRTSLLMVLTKERGAWQIAAYHNVWQAAAR